MVNLKKELGVMKNIMRSVSIVFVGLLMLTVTSCAWFPKNGQSLNSKPCRCGHHKEKMALQEPRIHLVSFMVPQYDGFWYYSKKIKPTKGNPGDRGAPLPMTFLFEVVNPNPYPIKLKGFRFTVSFEGFDLITVNDNNSYWIPAKRVDHIQVSTMITVRSALLSLLVTGGFKLKEKGWSPWDALKRWWEQVPTYDIPVLVKDGTASFEGKWEKKVISFSDYYPKD